MNKRINGTYGVPDKRANSGYYLIEFMYNYLISESLTCFKDREIDVLDIGTGSAYLLRLLNKRRPNWRLNGLDVNINALSICNDNRIGLFQGCADSLPFKDKSFDLVLSKSSLCYWDDVEKSLNEIKRVLKINGRFYIMDVNKNKFLKFCLIFLGRFILGVKKQDMADFCNRAYSIDEIETILVNIGLKYKIKKFFFGSYFLISGFK